MSNGSGISWGDRNRNTRLTRLRTMAPVSNVVVGIDLADNKQMVVVTDHDSKVLVYKTFRSRTWAAAMSLICDRDGGDLVRTRRRGPARLEQAVRREITRRGHRVVNSPGRRTPANPADRRSDRWRRRRRSPPERSIRSRRRATESTRPWTV